MGGVGKTQIAARSARQAWSTGAVDLLVWVTATTREAVEIAYAQAAAEIFAGLDEDPPQAALRFLGWLQSTNKRWMIVLDDVLDPSDIRGLWPPIQESSQTLVTTRRRDAALRGQSRSLVQVDTFSPEEARAYFSAKLDENEMSCAPEEIDLLANDLGYLPLAMAQAASYIVDQGLGVRQYRERLADHRRKLVDLLPDDSGLPDDQQAALAAVWDLSIDLADEVPPVGLASAVLCLASMLEPNGVPTAILASSAARTYLAICRHLMNEDEGNPGDQLPEIPHELVVSALRTLHRLSLVSHAPDEPHQLVRIHPLIQRVTRESVDREHRSELSFFAAASLLEMWPRNGADRDLCQILRENADTLSGLAAEDMWENGSYHVRFRCAESYGEAGMISSAISQWRELGNEAEIHIGSDHSDALECHTRLGVWQARDGNFSDAMETLRALYGCLTRTKGPSHADTIWVAGELANLLGHGGAFRAAGQVFKDLRPKLLELYGETHRLVVEGRCQEAYWLGRSGDPEASIDILQDVLSSLPEDLSDDVEFLCIVRQYIVDLRAASGDLSGSVRELESVLDVEVQYFGAEHPEVLITRHNLACLRSQAGDDLRAISELRDLLVVRERVLGEMHSRTVNTRMKLQELRSAASGDGADGNV
ncbi:NB-ARC domain-containing protein [Streptomyces sp. WAC06614]|uniref:NB-ARC domain-containing protein n=1 Tax=Streptomyces sp. WAC06614 TaxID=2487416 RepID=UPI0021B034DC|nr:NB-ARC domain-containing protein [Streptomyces sp. WAC06614]